MPVCRFVIELVASRFSLSIAECKIRGTYDFSQYGKVSYLSSFNTNKGFGNQSLYTRLIKYMRLHWYIFYTFFIKGVNILYTPEIHVLTVFFKLNNIFKREVQVIYHQLELQDLSQLNGNNLKLWQYVLKNVKQIKLCIFPEVNRLYYFCEQTGFSIEDCIVFPNSCKDDDRTAIKPETLQNIPEEDLVIAHCGNVGENHYLTDFLNFVNYMSADKTIHFVMIGRFSERVEKMFTKVINSNFHVIGEVPHSELGSYYSFIDIGFILYRGVDLNFEYCAPNKLYEYWSYGIYVLGHPLKGLLNVIDDNRVGMLLDLEDIHAIKKAVENFRCSYKNETRGEIKRIFKEKYSIGDSLKLLNKRLDEFT